VGQGLLIVQASRSHSDTPHSVGLLWTSDQPDPQLPDKTQYSQGTDIYAPGSIRTHIPSKRAAADPRLRPRGHWMGHYSLYPPQILLSVDRVRDHPTMAITRPKRSSFMFSEQCETKWKHKRQTYD
jgi:hypothetical protein